MLFRVWFLLLLAPVFCSCVAQGSRTLAFDSKPVWVDGYRPPDKADQTVEKILLQSGKPREMVWLTGIEMECREAESGSRRNEFLGDCTLGFSYTDWHNERFSTKISRPFALLNRGVTRFAFPSGFGLPMTSNESLRCHYRFINQDPYQPRIQLRQSALLSFDFESGLGYRPHALQTRHVVVNEAGNNHWFVHSPLEVKRFSLSQDLKLEAPTTLHAAMVLLQEGAKSAALVDQATGQILLKLKAQSDRSGKLSRVEHYSDPNGIVLEPSHNYELWVSYGSSDGRPVRASAEFMLYLFEPNYEPLE